MPRPNGYQSLHTSVISENGIPFEVQIRTEEMHRRAEEGIAAHWKYKEGRVGDHRDERYFQWMRQLLEVQQEVRDPQEFLQNLKIDLYPEEVYIFTPKGESAIAAARRRPPVDFAYMIHTDVGNQCVGARVNGKMVPLRTRLQNGDIVEIVTQSGSQAEPRLADVSSSRARAQQDQARAPGRGAGRAASSSAGGCSRRRRAASISIRRRCSKARSSRSSRPDTAHRSPRSCSRTSATASLSPRTVLQKSVPRRTAEERPQDSAVVSVVKRVLRPGATRQDQSSRHRRHHGVPREVLQPDPRREDRRLHHARQGRVGARGDVPERPEPDVRSRSAASTSSGTRRTSDQAPYTVRLTMQVEDRKGMLAEISAKVSDINTNITNMEARTGDDQQARIDMTVEISDVKHLERVIKSIKGVQGVLGVERTARA